MLLDRFPRRREAPLEDVDEPEEQRREDGTPERDRAGLERARVADEPEDGARQDDRRADGRRELDEEAPLPQARDGERPERKGEQGEEEHEVRPTLAEEPPPVVERREPARERPRAREREHVE